MRAVRPDADIEAFAALLAAHLEDDSLTRAAVEDLYRRADPAAHGLSDLGYLARVHPLELWLARWLTESPAATLPEVLEASREARQEVYGWLFRTSRRNAQDQRIRSLLELEAFEAIHQSWQRLGYPFDALVPSYGTAIGSSGDRPAALAELLGIILNDGVRYPTVRVDALLFAEGTPFETRLAREPATWRVRRRCGSISTWRRHARFTSPMTRGRCISRRLWECRAWRYSGPRTTSRPGRRRTRRWWCAMRWSAALACCASAPSTTVA